jgi:hypothetical protein
MIMMTMMTTAAMTVIMQMRREMEGEQRISCQWSLTNKRLQEKEAKWRRARTSTLWQGSWRVSARRCYGQRKTACLHASDHDSSCEMKSTRIPMEKRRLQRSDTDSDGDRGTGQRPTHLFTNGTSCSFNTAHASALAAADWVAADVWDTEEDVEEEREEEEEEEEENSPKPKLLLSFFDDASAAGAVAGAGGGGGGIKIMSWEQ